MKFTDADSVRRAMNDLGREGRPFLFAVDFELVSGFVVPEPVNGQGVWFCLPGQTSGMASGAAPGLVPGTAPRPSLGTTGGKAQGEVREARPTGASSPAARIKAMGEGLGVYAERFKIVQRGLARGDSYLVNLTLKTPIECPLSLTEIFGLSDAPYGLCVPGRFVSFSPERFVKIDPFGQISTNPMKGTIDASVPDAERVIMDDRKEAAEHATVVDLLRNDLSLSAKRVRVKRYRYADRLKTSDRELLQISSEIVGELGADFKNSLGETIFRMLPAGSVSGAPKESTLDIIRRAEGIPRGFYAGVFGLFDGTALDSAVLIRFIEEDGGQKYFRSGGGITALSGLEDEYREALEKIYLPFGRKSAG
ncbi:MAG: aminodeoxychorismate synthase component I [Deltaproteobacteria bacterium]|jgi:para-aminobenzoate synthetase component 1|nr:aminodeoxychorismate synthase component I [Deltaproteobacteria bacterium]